MAIRLKNLLKDPLPRFILLLAALVGAGLILRFIYHSSPSVSFFIQHSLFIDTFYRLLIGPTSFLLSITGIPQQVGYDPVAVQYYINITETRYNLYLWIPCLGISLMYVYASLIISFPASWKRKLVFVIGGWFAIQVLNILRLFGVALLLAHDHSGNNYLAKNNWFVLNHEDLFNYFVVFLIFMMFVLFAGRVWSDHQKTVK